MTERAIPKESDHLPQSLPQLAGALASGRCTSRGLVEACLARYADPHGEGSRTFITLDAAVTTAAAAAADRRRAAGRARSAYDGIPIAIKDLFDVAGERTRAGSRAFDDRPPASRDAHVVARLRAAGFLPFGRTNMTEFAYSGLGLNAHFGTPANPWRRHEKRIPGGSTSGGAVAVADGMAPIALGSDTGGSCRIPAAFCGVVGFKPTAARIPTAGTVPLAPSFDSIGSLGTDVQSCAIVDAVLAGQPPHGADSFPIEGARLAVPQTFALDALAPEVGQSFQQAISRLSRSGARILDIKLQELAEIPEINSRGGIVNAEAWGYHRRILASAAARYDPWVLARFDVGKRMNVADYIEMCELRADLIARIARITAPFDALICPTVATVPPTIDSLGDLDVSNRANGLILRNPSIGNFLDRCAVSIPCNEPGDAPVGLMLIGEHGADRKLLALAHAVEQAVKLTRS
ncbi:MAG: amidase [Hyphomicrobiales bacterium]|nr:amidase [Hyphomicrobiales bacterium]